MQNCRSWSLFPTLDNMTIATTLAVTIANTITTAIAITDIIHPRGGLPVPSPSIWSSVYALVRMPLSRVGDRPTATILHAQNHVFFFF